MTKKKDILFVMNNLNVGGAEKALVSILQVFDYERYNVDLLLFKKEGLFLKQVPREVNILDEPENYRYFDMSFIRVLRENVLRSWNVIFRRVQFKIASKKAKNSAEAEQFSWHALSKTMPPLRKRYDVAVGFLEKNPNYFVVDKVKADKKLGWIHNDYNFLQMNAGFDQKYFELLNHVVTVSDQANAVLTKVFPKFTDKFIIIENISSKKLIQSLKREFIADQKSVLKIVSVGRLTPQKGYHLGINAAKILKNEGIPFQWEILGEGPLKKDLSARIIELKLQDHIELLGVKENPYPYIYGADIFLQTSVFEGKSVAVDEAKILCKTIVLTNFNTASEQIQHEYNGLICEMKAESVANALIRIVRNPQLASKFYENLSKENGDSESEILKLYQLIEE